MIENRLTYYELASIIEPILKLETDVKIRNSFEQAFKIELPSYQSISNHCNEYFLTYKKFKVFIAGISKMHEDKIYIHMDFRIKRKLWFNFFDPRKKIIDDLKQIVHKNLAQFSFLKYETVAFSKFYGEQEKLVYHHDAKAFNLSWNEGYEISSLLISESKNSSFLFITFLFNPNCYVRKNDEIILKKSWQDHVSDIPNFINERVEEISKNWKN